MQTLRNRMHYVPLQPDRRVTNDFYKVTQGTNIRLVALIVNMSLSFI